MTQLSTVGVDCPRCDVKIQCTLKIEKSELSVPDLADRFAEHYRDAGHVRSAPSGVPDMQSAAQALMEFANAGVVSEDLVAVAARRMGLPVVHNA